MKSSESFNATSSTAIPFLTASHLILPYLTRHPNCPSISLELWWNGCDVSATYTW